MENPPRPTRPRSRLPRAIVFCLIGGFLVGVFTQWPVWVCVLVVVGASALLSGLLTSGRTRRNGERPNEEPGT